MSVTLDQCEIPDYSSAALCSLSVYKVLVGGSMELSGRTMQNILNCCTWQNQDRDQKKNSLYSGPESAPVFFEIQPFWFYWVKTFRTFSPCQGELFHC